MTKAKPDPFDAVKAEIEAILEAAHVVGNDAPPDGSPWHVALENFDTMVAQATAEMITSGCPEHVATLLARNITLMAMNEFFKTADEDEGDGAG